MLRRCLQTLSLVSHFAFGALALMTAGASVDAGTNVGGLIVSDTTWGIASSPYVVTSSVVIGGNATLTIEPGVELRFDPGRGISVGSPGAFGAGSLVAIGAQAAPILFTSNAMPGLPAAGDWNDIFFTDLTVDAMLEEGVYQFGSILEQVIVEYAGGTATASGSISIVQSSPAINEVEVRHSARTGIRVDATDGPAVRIVGCEIWDCQPPAGDFGAGLYLTGGSGHFIEGNNIHDNAIAGGGVNGGAGAYFQIAGVVAVVGNRFENNVSSNSRGGFYSNGLTNMTFDNNIVRDNLAMGVGNNAIGGARLQATTLSASGNEFTGNIASNTGGIEIASTSATLTDNIVVDNHATSIAGDAGGIRIASGVGVYSGNTIAANTAGDQGGGIFIVSNGNWFSGNIIDGNGATSGGGVYLNGSNTTWSSNVFTGNAASSQGGAIHNLKAGNILAGDAGAGSYNVLIDNTAPQGPAIYHAVNAGASGNLPAQFVCWGTNDQAVVETMIFDFFDDSSLGIVLTIPLERDCQPCPADLSGDGVVDGADLGILLGAWGSADPAADLDGSGLVDGGDLGQLLGSWGACGPVVSGS